MAKKKQKEPPVPTQVKGTSSFEKINTLPIKENQGDDTSLGDGFKIVSSRKKTKKHKLKGRTNTRSVSSPSNLFSWNFSIGTLEVWPIPPLEWL